MSTRVVQAQSLHEGDVVLLDDEVDLHVMGEPVRAGLPGCMIVYFTAQEVRRGRCNKRPVGHHFRAQEQIVVLDCPHK